jgi:hypothetical protein
MSGNIRKSCFFETYLKQQAKYLIRVLSGQRKALKCDNTNAMENFQRFFFHRKKCISKSYEDCYAVTSNVVSALVRLCNLSKIWYIVFQGFRQAKFAYNLDSLV